VSLRPAGAAETTVASRALWLVADIAAVAVGVALMISALAFGHSASEISKRPAYGVDPNLVVVSGVSRSSSGIQAGFPTSSITTDDVTALANPGDVPAAVAVAPTTGARGSIGFVARSWTTDLVGTTSGFAGARGYGLASGRSLTPADVQNSAPVVVIGQTVARALFPAVDPVGQDVTIDDRSMQVVGTFAAKGYAGGYDQDDFAIMPITTAWATLNGGNGRSIDQVLIRAATPAGAKAAAREATTTLLRLHGVTDPALADFTVQTQAKLVSSPVQTAVDLRRILELAGALLLMVGILQLATVQTSWNFGRERGDDLLDVLPEALAVGLVASMIGVLGAVAATPLMHRLAPQLPGLHVTLYGVVAGAAMGVAAAALAAVFSSLKIRRRARAARMQPVRARTAETQPGW
jgi:ABC-type antimicrobial peptide transport system permease subunit